MRRAGSSLRATGANARPMTGSVKQSIFPRKGRMDYFAALAMTLIDMNSRSRGANHPSFAKNFPPSPGRGRRESRVRAAPAVSCAVCTKEIAHEHTGPAENTRPSLRNGFTAYIVISLVRRALLPPSPVRTALTNLTPASGAGTTRLRRTRSATFVFVTSASTASHRNVRDDGRRPWRVRRAQL
jgi:hypothetical protein